MPTIEKKIQILNRSYLIAFSDQEETLVDDIVNDVKSEVEGMLQNTSGYSFEKALLVTTIALLLKERLDRKDALSTLDTWIKELTPQHELPKKTPETTS